MGRSVDLNAVYCFAFAVTGAGLSQGLRLGLEPFRAGRAWEILLVLALLLFASSLWMKAATAMGVRERYQCLALPFVQFAVFSLGNWAPLAGALVYLGMLAIVWLVGWSAVAVVRQREWLGAALVIGIVAPTSAFLLFSATLTGEGASPVLELAAMLGAAHPDVLFKAAYTQMWQNYGVLSTGIDGLVPLAYHAFDGLWYGNMAAWLRAEPLQVMGLWSYCFLVPLALFNAVICIFAMSEASRHSVAGAFAAVIFIVIIFVSVVGQDLFADSAMVATVIFAPMLPLLTCELTKPYLSYKDVILSALLCIVTLTLFFAKASFGVVVLALLFYVITVRVRGTALKAVAAVVPVLTLLVAYSLFAEPGRAQGFFSGGALFRAFLDDPGRFLQQVSFIVLSWLILNHFRAAPLTAVEGALRAAPDRGTLLLLALAAALLPSLVAAAGPADVFYFLLPVSIMAMVFVIAHLPALWPSGWTASRRTIRTPRGAGMVLAAACLALLVLPMYYESVLRPALTLYDARTYVFSLFEQADTNLPPASDEAGRDRAQKRWKAQLIARLRAGGGVWPAGFTEKLPASPMQRVLDTVGRTEAEMAQVGADPLGFVVFLPKNHPYWAAYPPYWEVRRDPASMYRLAAASLWVPAVSGHPLVFGLPAGGLTQRGFDGYDLATSHWRGDDVSDDQLCQHAAHGGFTYVLRFQSQDSDNTPGHAAIVSCTGERAGTVPGDPAVP